MTAPKAIDSGCGGADGNPHRGALLERALQMRDGQALPAADPHPTGGGAGDHAERSRVCHLSESIDGSLQGMGIAVGLIGPHDGRGMGLVECIAKTGFGASASDRRPL